MNSFRQMSRQALLVWSLLLCVALLGAQGVKLHIHHLDHGSDNQHSHSHTIDEAGDHRHLSQAHFTHDISHDTHHDGAVSEVDISPDGILKNINSSAFAVTLSSLLLTLMIFVSSRQRVQRYRESKLILYRYYLLSPPLRAPPQY